MNSQIKETHGARYGERARIVQVPSRHATPPNLHVFTNPKALQTISCLDFFYYYYGGFLHRHDWLAIWSLVIESTSSSSPLPGNRWVEQKAPTLYSWLVLLTTSLILRGYLKVTSFHINLFRLYGTKVFPGTEDKRQGIVKKDVPIAVMLRKLQGYGN